MKEEMRMPKVTVITVCYNSERTIEQTIRSVLSQPYKNIEYIIIDGGSQDRTLEIVKKYQDYIRIISEPDDGLYHAMNKGIIRSTGDIIGIINSDDWYEDNAIELAVNYLETYDCDLVHGACKRVYGNEIICENVCEELEELRYRMVIFHPTVFVKRDVYEKYGIFNQKYRIAADYDLMLRFYECGVKMVGIHSNMAYFRTQGVSSSNYKKTMEEFKEISMAHWNGDLAEIKEKIEKYSGYRISYEKAQMLMKTPTKNIKNLLLDIFPNDREYVIFGAGNLGLKCMEFLQKNGIIVENFIDNSPLKWGTSYGGIKIEAPEYLIDKYKNIIIANLYYKEDIQEQLTKMNFVLGTDFICIEDILKKL